MAFSPNAIVAGRIVLVTHATKIWYDEVTEEEGDYFDDAAATLIYLSSVYFLLHPVSEAGIVGTVILTPAAAAVWVPVVVGGIIVYVLFDGDEGLAQYGEFLFEGPKYWLPNTLGNNLLWNADTDVAEEGGSVAIVEDRILEKVFDTNKKEMHSNAIGLGRIGLNIVYNTFADGFDSWFIHQRNPYAF